MYFFVRDALRANGPYSYQPRAAPWVIVIKKIKALKGRPHFVAPLQGFVLLSSGFPGRCPGLAWFAPLVLKTHHTLEVHDTP